MTLETAALTSEPTVGGPTHGSTMDAGPGDAPRNDPTPAQLATNQVWQSGVRTFKTPEEMLEYTKDLERQTVESRLAAERASFGKPQATLNNSRSPAEGNPAEPAIEDLIFTKPKEAISKIEERAEARVMKKLNEKEAERKFFEDLYSENPDLRSAGRIVQSVLGEKWNELSSLPLADARKALASASRKEVDKIRGSSGGTVTELKPASASTLPTSGGPAQVVSVVQGAPETFVDQMKRTFKRKPMSHKTA